MSDKATVTIKGQVYDLPPLTTGQLRRHAAPLLERIRSLKDGASMEEALGTLGEQSDLLHMALQNRYPSITLEDVESMFLGDTQNAVADLIAISGMARRANEGETKAPAKRKR